MPGTAKPGHRGEPMEGQGGLGGQKHIVGQKTQVVLLKGVCHTYTVHTHMLAWPSGESFSLPRNKLKNIVEAYLISDVAFKHSLQTSGRSLQFPRILLLSPWTACCGMCDRAAVTLGNPSGPTVTEWDHEESAWQASLWRRTHTAAGSSSLEN